MAGEGGGGFISVKVKVNLDVIGLEELTKAQAKLDKLRKGLPLNVFGKGNLGPTKGSKAGLTGPQQQTGSKSKATLTDLKRQSSIHRSTTKDLTGLSRAAKTAQAELAKIRSGRPVSGGGGGGGGGGGSRGGGGGFFGSGAKGDRTGGFGGRLKSVAEFAVAAKVLQAGFSTLAKIPETIVGVDKELKELNKVLATSGKNLDNLRKSAVATGSEFGNSITSVLKGFKVFAQQGLKTGEIIERGRAVSLAENVSTLNTDEAAETITAGLKVFGSQVGNSGERLIDSFVAVESQNAVTAADLSEVVKRVGIAAKNAGTTFDELAGFTTVIQESTRAGGGRISRALKFTFKNLFDQARQGDLEQIGVSTRDTTGDLRDAPKVLEDISKKWGGLTRAQKRNIAVNIGGTRFQNEFNALMEDFGKVSTVAAQSQNAAGTASQRNAIIMQSLSKKGSKVVTAFEGLSSSVGGGVTAPIGAALDAASGLLSVLTSIAEMKFPGLATLQGLTGTAESEQTGTVGDLIGNTASFAVAGTVLAKGFTKAIPKSSGLLTKALIGSNIASGAFSRISDKSTGGAGGFVQQGLLAKGASKGGGILAKMFPKLGKFGTAIARIAPGLLVFGSTLLSILGPLAALAAIVGVTTLAFNRLTETSEARDQRTGLNARREKLNKGRADIEAIGNAFDTSQKERATAVENLAGPGQEEAAKESERRSAERDKKSQKKLREFLVNVDKKDEGLFKKLGINIEKGVGGRDEFIFNGANISDDSSQGIQAARDLQRVLQPEQTQKAIGQDIKKAFSSFSDIDATVKVGSSGLKTFTDALDRTDATRGVSSLFRGVLSAGLSSADPLSRAERDTLANKDLQVAGRAELSRDLSSKLIDAAEQGPESLGKALNSTLQGVDTGALQDFVTKSSRFLDSGLTSGEAREQTRRKFLQSNEFKESREKNRVGIGGLMKSLALLPLNPQAALAPIAKSFQATSQAQNKFLQREAKQLALGAEVDRFQRGAVAAGGQEIDLASVLKTKEGQDLTGQERLDKISSFKTGTTFRKKDTGKLFTKIGDELVASLPDGTTKAVKGGLSGERATEIFDNAVLLKFSAAASAASLALDKVATSGFGAGNRLDLPDISTGPSTLSGLSDQQAGSFLGTDSQSGAKFNKGFQQFIGATSDRIKKRNELIQGKDTEGAAILSKQIQAATMIIKASEIFGASAKAIEQAARQFANFQRARTIRGETSVDPTTNALFKGGFEKLILGRSQSELTANEVTQQQNPELARRLADLQFQQKQTQADRVKNASAGADFETFLKSQSLDSLKSFNTEEALKVLGTPGGFQGASLEDPSKAITALIEGGLSKGDTDEKIRKTISAFFQGITKVNETDTKLTVEGKVRAEEILELQGIFRARESFNSIKLSAERAEESFQNASRSAGGIDEALSTAFKAQGSQSRRLFTGKAGDSKDQLSQVRGLDRLNQFERSRREASLLSSSAVQQGRRQVFDENRNRVSPISKQEAAARVQDSRLNERRARKASGEQAEQNKFSARKGQLESTLSQVRSLQTKDLGKDFKRVLDNIEKSLVGVQNKKATSFFSSSGKFNESAFGPLLNIGSTLERELKSAGLSSVASKVSKDPQASALDNLQEALIKSKADRGLLPENELKSAIASGIITKEEGEKLESAANAKKFEPITSKLDVIAGLISSIVSLLGGSQATDVKKIADQAVKSQDLSTITKEAVKQVSRTSQRSTLNSDSQGAVREEDTKKSKSISDLLSQGKVITDSDLEQLNSNDVQSGGTSGFRSFGSDKRLSTADTSSKNAALGRTAETDKIALANLLKRTPQESPLNAQDPLTSFQQASSLKRQKLGSNKEAADAFARNQPQPEPNVLVTQNDLGQSIRNVRRVDSSGPGNFTGAGNDGAGFRQAQQDTANGIVDPEIARMQKQVNADLANTLPAGSTGTSVGPETQQISQSLKELSTSLSQAKSAKDANMQKSETRQEKSLVAQQTSAKANDESNKVVQGTSTPTNQRQASENREVTVANVDAVGQAVQDGVSQGAEDLASAMTTALENADITVSTDSAIGGAANDLESKLDAFIQTQEDRIIIISDNTSDNKLAVTSLQQELSETNLKVSNIEAQSASTQPLEESSQTSDEANSKADNNRSQILANTGVIETLAAQVNSLEGRLASAGSIT